MSNALLLRLFTSEFFNSWIAVSYLFRYPDNVGIQHYLCNELKSFPMSEIEFFLPQLVHLLISRPSESVALECFILDQCQRSTHMALMTLWYLQAHLSDCSSNPTSPSFMLCKRVFNKCQAIVFDGSSTQIELADSGSVHPEILTNKVKENVAPALVGMAAMLAGIGQPLMTKAAGQIAIAQGRRNRALSITEPPHTALARRNTVNGDGSERNSYDEQSVQRLNLTLPKAPAPSELNHGSLPSSPTTISPPQRGPKPPFQSASQPDLPIPKRLSLQLHHVATSPSLEDLHRGKAFSVGRYLKHAQQKINRKINPSSSGNSLPGTFSVFDPSTTALAKSTVPTVSAPLSPSLSQVSSTEEIFFGRDHSGHAKGQSSYSISTDSFSSQVYDGGDSQDGSDSDDEISTLSRLSVDHRRSLLKSNYFNSEMQFLLALIDIATRLVIVPKHARVSSLHAELTLLNHNLPAEVCIPLWCPATMEKPHHHRVAPYLLLIEVLDDDLSFDDYKSLATLKKRKQRKAERRRRRENAKAEAVEQAKAESPELADSEEHDPSKPESNTPSDEPLVARNRSSTQLPTTVHMPSPLNTSFTPNDLPRDDNSLQGIPSDLTAYPDTDQQTKTANEFAERMRTAAIMLAQLQQQSVASKLAPSSSPSSSSKGTLARTKLVTDGIRQRIIKEMMALEEQRMAKMKVEGVEGGIGGGGGEGAGGSMLEDETRVALVVNKEDPSAAVFAEDWEEKKARIRTASPYGHLPNWRLISVIVKNGADLRQEQFAIQLIREMQRIWQDNGVDVWVK
ncbi:hypothetical protein BGW37DRAFT_513211 [Umbelopsis sp. PMI_123]|nr:hypothetical protein BGW37DRAFT_513211 [Umbelopsis sp. PMI_123]